jgi:hypothetical protein
MSRQLVDINSQAKLQLAVRSVADYRARSLNKMSLENFVRILVQCDRIVWNETLKFESYCRFLDQLQQIDSRLIPFFIAVVLLHVLRQNCQIEGLIAADTLLKCSQNNNNTRQESHYNSKIAETGLLK